MKKLFAFIVVSLFLIGCGKYNEEELSAFDKKIEAYILKKGLKMTKSDSGLYYQIHEEGEGEYIKPTAILSTKYTGKLLSGKIFDEQREPVELNLRQLVHGWREIAHYLKPGGKATIICPPQLGYGKSGKDEIPEDAILIFDIEIEDAY